MKAHTNNFKNEIKQFGRKIKTKVFHYFSFALTTEDEDILITEDGNILITEQFDEDNGEQITEEDIYEVKIIQDGQLLKSLMKRLDIETKADLPIKDTLNVKFGLLVNNDYEYLDYGNYIVYKKSYNANNKTWVYVCYDKMLYSMIQYSRLNISYPTTIRNYLKAIAIKMGIGFASESDEFTNYDQAIKKDYFKGKNVTLRDILDFLSEATASVICISSNDELEVRYTNETNDVINEDYLKDVNVNFGEAFGPINKITFVDSENEMEYTKQDDLSLLSNKAVGITITDNPIILNNPDTISENILNKVKNIVYSLNDFDLIGICYYDFLDLFSVNIEGNYYKCLLLNDEITITQGIKETIFTEKPENALGETNNYQNKSLTNKEIQQKIGKLDDNIGKLDESKVSNESIVNSINSSKEQTMINNSKFLMLKTFTGTTSNTGFLDIQLNGNYIVVCATADFTEDGYGFVIPYYHTYANRWVLKIESWNKTALANTNITVNVYYFEKERREFNG